MIGAATSTALDGERVEPCIKLIANYATPQSRYAGVVDDNVALGRKIGGVIQSDRSSGSVNVYEALNVCQAARASEIDG